MPTMTRTDIHRPSFLDPAEYREVGCFDSHSEEGFEEIDESVANLPYFDGNYTARHRCDHCGAGPLRFGVIFLHEPSQQLLVVGWQCANVLGLSSITEKQMRAKGEAASRRAKLAAWLSGSTDNQAAYDFLTATVEAGRHGYGGFYFDLLHKANRYGALSDKQVAAALRGRDRDAEFEAKRQAEQDALANVEPLPEGRYEITGEITSVKVVESDYGDQEKMLVKLDTGNKVWGTVPNAIFAQAGPRELVGLRVKFAAAIERSKNDEHFGFFKRPTKPQVIS